MNKKLLKDAVRSLVDNPDDVQIKEVDDEDEHVLEVRVAKEDLGKVTLAAVTRLMAAASGKKKKR